MTAIKSILMHLDDSPACATRLRAANAVAETLDASVKALYAVLPAFMQYAMAYSAGAEVAPLMAAFELERRSRTRALFDATVGSGTAKRLSRVYQQERALFDEASTKAGFFVSIDAPNGARIDLSNQNHWTVLLSSGADQGLKPVMVKRLDDKERWRAFFDTVNEWTTEYLVVFDTPSIDAKSPALVEKSGLTLTFANADAQVRLSW